MTRLDELEEELNHLRLLVRRLHEDINQQNILLATAIEYLETQNK